MLQFGNKIKNTVYITHPGAYGVMLDQSGKVGVLQTPNGFFLPGGGIDDNETPEQALSRELLYETGCRVRVKGEIGLAAQYPNGSGERIKYKELGHFYRIEMLDRDQVSYGGNNHLIWLTKDDAVRKLNEDYQSWAVSQV